MTIEERQRAIKEGLFVWLCVKPWGHYRECGDCIYEVPERGCDRVHSILKFLDSRGAVLWVEVPHDTDPFDKPSFIDTAPPIEKE